MSVCSSRRMIRGIAGLVIAHAWGLSGLNVALLEAVCDPQPKRHQSSEDECHEIFDDGDADNLVDLRPVCAVDGDYRCCIAQPDQPTDEAGEVDSMHLGDDEHGGEAEEEHAPDVATLKNGDHGTVEEHRHFL